MIKVPQINCFSPKIKFFNGKTTLNDYLQINLYFCNFLGLKVTLFGFGFEIRIILYEAHAR